MRKRFIAQFLIILLYLPNAFSIMETNVEVFTDEERMRGFAEHNRQNNIYDKERLSDAGEIKEIRAAWQKKLQDAIVDYKAWKAKQKQAIDESSEEYFEDRRERKKERKELDEARKEYIIAREKRRAQKKVTVKLSEEKEFGLDENNERVEFRKRALYFPDLLKKDKNKIGGGSSTGSGAVDFGTPPPDFNPPVSQPPAPEFFEPEAPPPPPDFEDSIPPPIFEDTPDF